MNKLSIPDDFRRFMALVREGRVFEIADWVNAGRIVRLENSSHWAHRALLVATKLGNHAMVQVLLRDDGWGREELDRCLWEAVQVRRSDLIELLIDAGAHPRSVDLASLARTSNLSLIKRFIALGVDPLEDHGFARALDATRAKPMLRLFRELREQFPGLDAELNLALLMAVSGSSPRWVALLIWAGADPMARVPRSPDIEEVDPEMDLTTPAAEACWRGDPEIFDSLQMQPNESDKRELLRTAVMAKSRSILPRVLKWFDDLNHGERDGSSELEDLLRMAPSFASQGRVVDDFRYGNSLQTMRMLLEAGARWRPSLEEIGQARRSLLQLDGMNLKRTLVLLLEFPDSVTDGDLAELLRTPSARKKLETHDKYFAARIYKMRKG